MRRLFRVVEGFLWISLLITVLVAWYVWDIGRKCNSDVCVGLTNFAGKTASLSVANETTWDYSHWFADPSNPVNLPSGSKVVFHSGDLVKINGSYDDGVHRSLLVASSMDNDGEFRGTSVIAWVTILGDTYPIPHQFVFDHGEPEIGTCSYFRVEGSPTVDLICQVR